LQILFYIDLFDSKIRVMASSKKKKAWFIWSALLVFYLFMAIYGMGEASKAIESKAKNATCARPLDLHLLGLNFQEAHLALDCMGNDGRVAYRQIEEREDIFYPISYGLFYAFTIYGLASFLRRKTLWKWIMAAVPLLVMISDFIENRFIVRLIDQFPAIESGVVENMSLLNTLKWSGFFITIALIVMLGILSLVFLLKGNRQIALVEQD
jgi:hypothetical protein